MKSERSLFGALVCVMIFAYYGTDVIAAFYLDAGRAAKAWAYVGQQIEAMVLFLGVIALARFRGLVVIGLWGFVERSENAICRLAFPMDRPPPKTEPLQGLCDLAAGFPVYMLSIWALLIAVILWYRSTGRDLGHG